MCDHVICDRIMLYVTEPKAIERTVLVTSASDLQICGEMFLSGLVCGEEVLSTGCSKVSHRCDSTGNLA